MQMHSCRCFFTGYRNLKHIFMFGVQNYTFVSPKVAVEMKISMKFVGQFS